MVHSKLAADAELEKLCLHQLNSAAKDFMSAGGGGASLAALALAGLTAASAAATAAGVGGSEGAPLLAGGSEGAGGEAGSAAAGGSKAGAHAADATSGSSGSAGLFAAGRSGFMQRAFARQPAAGHASGAGSGEGSGPGSEQAWALFQQRVREFNACVAYAGLTAGEQVAGDKPGSATTEGLVANEGRSCCSCSLWCLRHALPSAAVRLEQPAAAALPQLPCQAEGPRASPTAPRCRLQGGRCGGHGPVGAPAPPAGRRCACSLHGLCFSSWLARCL